jgi:hypothetical protein
MNFLFSFLEPNRPHGTLLAGYFSKVFCDDTRNLVSLLFIGNVFPTYASVAPLLDYNFFHHSGCCVPYDTEDGPTYELCSSKKLV